jgi:hypothetical protein
MSNVAPNYVGTEEQGHTFALGEITLSARVKVAFELK